MGSCNKFLADTYNSGFCVSRKDDTLYSKLFDTDKCADSTICRARRLFGQVSTHGWAYSDTCQSMVPSHSDRLYLYLMKLMIL